MLLIITIGTSKQLPYLKSLTGISMLRNYVSNWPSVLAVYFGLKKSTRAIFRNGRGINITKSNYSEFYEEIYRLHNISRGVRYSDEFGPAVTMPSGIRIKLPKGVYSNVIDEIFFMKVYNLTDLREKVAIDIGASVGDSSLYFALNGADVYAFEPDKERFAIASENISVNAMQKKIRIYETAVSTMREVDSICRENKERLVFLKMDCEGCEYSVLNEILPENIRFCAIEYHAGPDKIRRALASQGFKVKLKRKMLYAIR